MRIRDFMPWLRMHVVSVTTNHGTSLNMIANLIHMFLGGRAGLFQEDHSKLAKL